jgi:catechol 2,3-dioxygenase-like lactoylglutathione lyase family enzyme
MLNEANAVANIAVENLETARKFYHDTLGLKQVHTEGEEVIVFKSGSSTINVYRSQYAGSNKATRRDMGSRRRSREFGTST